MMRFTFDPFHASAARCALTLIHALRDLARLEQLTIGEWIAGELIAKLLGIAGPLARYGRLCLIVELLELALEQHQRDADAERADVPRLKDRRPCECAARGYRHPRCLEGGARCGT